MAVDTGRIEEVACNPKTPRNDVVQNLEHLAEVRWYQENLIQTLELNVSDLIYDDQRPPMSIPVERPATFRRRWRRYD